MIRYLKGKYFRSKPGQVVVETGSGIGFTVHIPDGSNVYLQEEGSFVKLFTSLKVREDDMSLYGFDHEEDLELFELLITVSGVGAKAGLSLMSCYDSKTLSQVIAMEDAKALTKAVGVGKKMAERIILELRNKVSYTGDEGDSVYGLSSDMALTSLGDERSQAIDALASLGYNKGQATAMVMAVEGDFDCEGYIREALKKQI